MSRTMYTITSPKAPKKAAIPFLEQVRSGSEDDKAEALVEGLNRAGVRKFSDIINPEFVKFGESVGANRIFKCGPSVKFASTGDDLLNGTSLIVGLMEQVTPLILSETLT